MTVPNYKEFYLPVLNFYKDKNPHSIDETLKFIENYFDFDEEDLLECSSNNHPKIEMYTKRAISYLCKMEVLEENGPNSFIISEEGLDFIQTNPKIINRKILKEFFEKINLNIENFGTISKSNIYISKINVIGGQNATGKSTASKLLYCFLKCSSSNHQEFAYQNLNASIDHLFFFIRRKMIIDKKDKNDINRKIYRVITRYMHQGNYSIYDKIDAYKIIKNELYGMDSSENNFIINLEPIREDIDEIDKYIRLIEEDGIDLYNLIMNNLLISEFSNKMKGFVEFKGRYQGNKFKFSSYFQDKYKFEKSGDLLINDVFYIDSFSCLDINQSNGLTNTNHVELLLKAVNQDSDESKDFFDPLKSDNIESILKCINSLIKGKFRYDDGELIYHEFWLKNLMSIFTLILIARCLLKQ